ncbi:hypothetical protein GCM10027160_41170 [Streptomyces calidiresistens]
MEKGVGEPGEKRGGAGATGEERRRGEVRRVEEWGRGRGTRISGPLIVFRGITGDFPGAGRDRTVITRFPGPRGGSGGLAFPIRDRVSGADVGNCGCPRNTAGTGWGSVGEVDSRLSGNPAVVILPTMTKRT